MKEIKAYVRRDLINQVVEQLTLAGAPGVSVIEIHPVGYGYEPSHFEPHFARMLERYRYLSIVKLEIFCPDWELERLIDMIQETCRTGGPGDGMIFISDVSDAVRIRDGCRGDGALECHGRRVI
jgi:nitrogen regulatory protein P-II 1